ncbi:tetratricopeptide repeat protein, partial [candidate division KSB3 bacterium]|nr:tetratricopeptide repeat protein [candidate division KSB3 bacterium]MBD3326764.1 tetratricopeptide repeat protein [candidate division KSB3 bacterium]
MRIWKISLFLSLLMLAARPGLGMEQKWVDDLNRRFPGIGYEFREAVKQKIAQHGGDFTPETLIERLLASPDYVEGQITNAKSFGLHSELMLLYPAVGKYQEALQEAELLRDFVLTYSESEPNIVQTFRGVYVELLIINEAYEAALEEIEALLTINPDEPGNYLSRGIILLQLGHLDRALEDLRTLLVMPETPQYAQQLFAFMLHHRDQFQEARVQPNTMIDVMLKDLEPEPQTRRITIPDQPTEQPSAASPTPRATPTPSPSPIPTPQPV